MGCFSSKKKSSTSKDEEEITQSNNKTVLDSRDQENSNKTPLNFDNNSDQNSSNEIIKISVNKQCYNNIKVIQEIDNLKNCSDVHENKSNKNKLDDNKLDENKVDDNKLDENKLDENKVDDNKFDDNKLDKNKVDDNKFDENKSNKIESIQECIENTKSKIRESRENFFACLYETESNKNQISEINKNVIWKPLGFANPKGYCYLNSVVQVLGSCEEFKKDIDLYNLNNVEKTKDSIFVEGLFDLIKAIRECNTKNLNKSLYIVQQNITESSFGDDVYKCFMNLLTRVSNVIKTNIDKPSDHFTSLPVTLSEKARTTFARFKNRNPGFVFDNFYGQLTFQTVCKLCNYTCNESFQMIKSLPLPVPNSNTSATLNSCVDLFFNESDVEVDEPMKCQCADGLTISLKSISKLTHGPKYLFIYLNRGSYTDDGVKNNTHVTCVGLTIDIKTLEDKSIKYNLISVIDHVGDSSYGHYYCKCNFESEEWWLLNDSQVKRLEDKNDIVTKNTIVFFFKKTLNC